jgi:hypothetical protein
VSTHLSRKELKQDNVALKVEETAHFLQTHRPLVNKLGVAVLAVLVVGLGSWFFISSRRDSREQALGAALALENATVGTPPAGSNGPNFPTDAAKSDAITKAFTAIMMQNSGTEEGYAAEYYLAGMDVSNGKMDEALKKYDHVVSGAGADYASLAKLGKAQVLFSASRSPEAQAILKDLIAHPTAMVSKEQATIILARGIGDTQPEEARKLLLPIASKGSDISQTAVTAMGDLPQK